FSSMCTAPTELTTLSLHDALPICGRQPHPHAAAHVLLPTDAGPHQAEPRLRRPAAALSGHPRQEERIRPQREEDAGDSRRARTRSEEHTSELQSRENLVCRLLLEK